jgi:hypothetical protein
MPERRGKYGVLSKEDMRSIIKKAHEECKKEVTFSRHTIGGTLGGMTRVSLRRSRADYLGCVRKKIQEQVDAKLKEIIGRPT